MNSIKKITILLSAIFICFFLLSFEQVSATSIVNDFDDWKIPIEWKFINVPDGIHVPKLYDVDGGLTKSIAEYCKPNVELLVYIYEGYDSKNNVEYIALMADIYVNPNNIKNKRCRSEFVKLESTFYDGGLVSGSPTASPQETTVTVTGGGGLTIGYDGSKVSGNIVGNFSVTKTENKPDLIISGYRKKINDNDMVNRKFLVEYNYRKGTRNDVPFLYSSTGLRYLAIYYKYTNQDIYSIDLMLYAKFTYDAPWPLDNKNITDTFNLKVSINTVIDKVTIS